jgi:kynureninase
MTNLQKAQALDQSDRLAEFYQRFYHPASEIYLDGNSLGKQPLKTKERLVSVLDGQWGQQLISSWNKHWLELPKRIAGKVAQLVNADSGEVVVGESTSVNLFKLAHALIESGLYPKRLITDSLNFPTDNYILEGISSYLKLSPPLCVSYSSDLEADVEQLKEVIRSNPGVLCLSLVSYKSAYYYPAKMLNDFAKSHDSIIIWDLSHAVGAVHFDVKETKTLAAIGCTYKYLNGGPGSPAFMFIDSQLTASLSSPIQGWFGHENPFDFSSAFEAAKGIEKFNAGTPQILSLAALEVGIDLTLEAGIKPIREKSEQLGNYLIQLISSELVPLGFALESPENHDQRGSHVTLSHCDSWRICQCLLNPIEREPKITIDFRPDKYIRIGIAPLYTRFIDLWQTVERLRTIVVSKEYEQHDGKKPVVT